MGLSLRRLLLPLLLAGLALVGGSTPAASAHPLSTSAVLLHVGTQAVGGEVQLPIDRLALAVHRNLTPGSVLRADHVFLQRYTARHISAAGTDGQPWTRQLGAASVQTIDGTAHLVYPLLLRPPDGHVTDVDLRYDVIVEQLRTHKVLVTVRHDSGRGILTTANAQTLGVIDFATTHLVVPAGQGSWWQGLTATAALGIEHVGSGADHLLFLLMLLVPAPLVASGGRWRPGPSVRRSALRVVHVVTAFAVGHSLTLALAATGVVQVPARPVEVLIAGSIAVSAVHALRPLANRGEALIAGSFGLVHGLAFASVIGDMNLDRGSLVTTLLGFNVGIELTQLLVLALLMPSLLVLARTALYPVLRTGLALVGLVFAVSWMLERVALTTADPFEGTQTWLVQHPLLIAAALASTAVLAHSHARLTTVKLATGTRTSRIPQQHDGASRR